MVVALKSRCWRCLQPWEEGSEQLCFLRKQLLPSFQAGHLCRHRHSFVLELRAGIKTTRTDNYGANKTAGWQALQEFGKERDVEKVLSGPSKAAGRR